MSYSVPLQFADDTIHRALKELGFSHMSARPKSYILRLWVPLAWLLRRFPRWNHIYNWRGVRFDYRGSIQRVADNRCRREMLLPVMRAARCGIFGRLCLGRLFGRLFLDRPGFEHFQLHPNDLSNRVNLAGIGVGQRS